jgi:DNA repair protein RadC
MPNRPERLYQLRFDENFKLTIPEDITPEGFTGLAFDKGEELGRFVREAREAVYVRSPTDAAQHLLTKVYVPFTAFDQEELWVLLLDTKLRITHEAMIYRGSVNAVSIRPAELLKEAVRLNSPSLIISHCHPSGDPTPSPEDVHVTRQIKEAAKVLGIDLVDHIIVGRDTWVSLKERNLGF